MLRIDSFWFHSYLHNRTQPVTMGKHIRKLDVTYGVPQGSVLGPILFSILVNNLSRHTPDCLVIQYTDDTWLIHTGSIVTFTMLFTREVTPSRGEGYFHVNGLLLNTTQTQCMFVGRKGLISQTPPNTCLQAGQTNIFPSSSLKKFRYLF